MCIPKEELLAVFDRDGKPTGESVPRSVAHSKGILHGASHVLICRQEQGRLQVLLQRRSACKDSYPGCLDISSAGHIEFGSDFVETARKELYEELGITARPEELVELFIQFEGHDGVFHGKPFVDREVNRVYLLTKPVDTGLLRLQPEEVSEVVWLDADEIVTRLRQKDPELCMITGEFMLAVAAARAHFEEETP